MVHSDASPYAPTWYTWVELSPPPLGPLQPVLPYASAANRPSPFSFLPAAGSDVGVAIIQYARDKSVGLVVVGSSGLGAWRSSFLGVMGLGSVSDHIHIINTLSS